MSTRLTFKEYVRDALITAGPLAAVGIFLVTQGHKAPEWQSIANYAGWVCIFLASLLTLWGLVSLFVPVLAIAFRQTWRSFWRLFVAAWAVLLAGYSRVLGFLLRPAVFRALQVEDPPIVTCFEWKAHQWRLYPTLQRADFRTLVRPRFRVRSISFRIAPDYRHFHWKAGFRLGPTDDDFERSLIADRFLFHIGAIHREG